MVKTQKAPKKGAVATGSLLQRKKRVRKITILELTLCDRVGAISTYPVHGVRSPLPAITHPDSLNHKHEAIYRIVSPVKRYYTTNDLINKQVILTDGIKRVKGTVVRVSVAKKRKTPAPALVKLPSPPSPKIAKTGGTTTPPSDAPLPPIDE